jgi:hypothetical protein
MRGFVERWLCVFSSPLSQHPTNVVVFCLRAHPLSAQMPEDSEPTVEDFARCILDESEPVLISHDSTSHSSDLATNRFDYV